MQPELSKTVIKNNIFTCTTGNFESRAIQVFNFQYLNNNLYEQFCEAIHVDPATVTVLKEFLIYPSAFLKHKSCFRFKRECPLFLKAAVLQEASTAAIMCSMLNYTRRVSMKGFELFYGDVKKYCVIGLLPSISNANILHWYLW